MLRSAVLLFFFVCVGLGSLSHAAEPLPPAKGPVILTISGKIEQTNSTAGAQFDKEMLEAIGRASITTRSEVSDVPQVFDGVPLRAVLDRVGAKGKAMRATALNDYVSMVPLEDLQFEPIIAMRVDNRLLTVRDKGPLWIVYPRDAHKVLQDTRYDSRWVWQLSKLNIE
jgi:hypothetical protein